MNIPASPATVITRISAFAAALLVSPAAAQSGGPYEITAWTTGAGATMSGGNYTLSGTVGQHDAGPAMGGGAFDLYGGFWPAAIAAEPCRADLAPPFGSLNFFDVAAFLGLFNANDPRADIAAPFGTINFFDLSTYIGWFNAGCP